MSKTEREMREEFERDISDNVESEYFKGFGKTKSNSAHPLLNPESSHYKMIGDIEAIEYFEKMFSKEELAVWAKITSMKYRMRVGNKSQVDATSDIKKIRTYEEYYKYLESK